MSGTFRRGRLVSGFTRDVVDFVVPDVGLPFPVLSAKKQGAAISRSESTARDRKESLKDDVQILSSYLIHNCKIFTESRLDVGLIFGS